MKRSALPAREKPMARTRMKKHARPKSETLRIYGPEERRAFVNSLPCCWCGKEGETENAHVVTGGTGRKSDYTNIAPLCRVCHREYDQWRGDFTIEGTREIVRTAAIRTEVLWQAHLSNTQRASSATEN